MAVSSSIESDGGNGRTKWRIAAATSLRRHDPDQVQRVRRLAVSAPFRDAPRARGESGPGAAICQHTLQDYFCRLSRSAPANVIRRRSDRPRTSRLGRVEALPASLPARRQRRPPVCALAGGEAGGKLGEARDPLSRRPRAGAIGAAPPPRPAYKARRSGRRSDEGHHFVIGHGRTMASSSACAGSDRRSQG